MLVLVSEENVENDCRGRDSKLKFMRGGKLAIKTRVFLSRDVLSEKFDGLKINI